MALNTDLEAGDTFVWTGAEEDSDFERFEVGEVDEDDDAVEVYLDDEDETSRMSTTAFNALLSDGWERA